MSDKTKIEWTDATWNPVRGCSLVSPGCTNCYAMREAHRLTPYRGLTRMTEYGPVWTGEVRLMRGMVNTPLHWKKPRRIFVNSMSDLFHEAVPDAFIDDLFATMALCSWHVFQILTKRPERMINYMHGAGDRVKDIASDFPARRGEDADEEGYLKIVWPLPNVWLGVSVENQKEYEERWPYLRDIPAAIRWLSVEPLLTQVNLNPISSFLDWVVVGGESGPRARPMHPDWVRSIRNQCQGASVPFFFKQWGEWSPHGDRVSNGSKTRLAVTKTLEGDVSVYRSGKKAAGALLDGREWKEFPK